MLTREQVDVLQDWGAGLERSGGSEELQAAGRAIRMLVEYIDGVERSQWHERAGVSDRIEGVPEGEPLEVGSEHSFLGALAKRIGSQQP